MAALAPQPLRPHPIEALLMLTSSIGEINYLVELQNGRVGRPPSRCTTALVESVQTAILVVSNLCDPTDLND